MFDDAGRFSLRGLWLLIAVSLLPVSSLAQLQSVGATTIPTDRRVNKRSASTGRSDFSRRDVKADAADP